MDYELTDKIIAFLDKQLIGYFSRMKSTVSFDELNVMQSIDAVYKEIERLIRETFLILAENVYNATAKNPSREIDAEWIDDILSGYDPVSKYVFTHEIDRKAARLAEAIIASDTPIKEIDAALRAMSFMMRVYAVRITDEAVLQALIDDGITRVEWIAEKDEKTCAVCHKRDGNVYPIANIPPKPHPNCRCTLRRIN